MQTSVPGEKYTSICWGHSAGKHLVRKRPGDPGNTELNRSQNCALAAADSWADQEYHCQWFKGGCPSPLLSTGETPGVLCPVLGYLCKRDMDILEQVQPRVMQGTETGACLIQGKAEGPEPIQPFEEKSFEGDLHHLNKHLTMLSKDGGARLFSVIPSDRARGNGHNLKQKKLHLGIRKKDFYITSICCPENL